MRKLLALLFLCMAAVVQAQDVIVKKDGSTISCRVVRVSDTEVAYQKWGSSQQSFSFAIPRAEVSAINYSDGRRVDLSSATSQYTPGNQNNGTRQYNDRALLRMDYNANKQNKQVKTLKTVGWVGFATIEAAALIYAIMAESYDDNSGAIIGIAAGGVVWGAAFLIPAYLKEKKLNREIYSFKLYQESINFSNGSSLTAGVDLLKDNMRHQQTLGLGLRYNF